MEGFRPVARFFMGANTPQGFVGFPEELYSAGEGWQVFLIKGGPGCGKSTLMRSLAHRMAEVGQETEEIRCSSDPRSLDGVIFRDSRQCVLDATAPHILEPRYWDAVETVLPVDGCIRAEEVAAHREAVMELTGECGRQHERVRSFLAAAASLLADGWRLAAEQTDRDKMHATATQLVKRELGSGGARPGRRQRRFLSAVTPEGLTVFQETLGALCPRIFSLEDESGAVAPLFLQAAEEQARALGWNCLTCVCPLDPARTEHLLIPEAGVAFTTSNSYHKADFPVYRRLHAARFLPAESLRGYRPRLSFERRAVRELLGEAASAAAEAKRLHDRLESYYSPAMDWEAMAALEKKTWDSMCRRLITQRSVKS